MTCSNQNDVQKGQVWYKWVPSTDVFFFFNYYYTDLHECTVWCRLEYETMCILISIKKKKEKRKKLYSKALTVRMLMILKLDSLKTIWVNNEDTRKNEISCLSLHEFEFTVLAWREKLSEEFEVHITSVLLKKTVI